MISRWTPLLSSLCPFRQRPLHTSRPYHCCTLYAKRAAACCVCGEEKLPVLVEVDAKALVAWQLFAVFDGLVDRSYLIG